MSTKEKIEQKILESPHVVILGAGASKAACPNGDKNGKILPLMNDFIDILDLSDLKSMVKEIKYTNFEDIYSHLHQYDKYQEFRIKLEKKVYDYFEKIEIPDTPTIYDLLLLSLRKKDTVATFNWDPLLVQAYLRNGYKFQLPNLLFLHGNVSVGYCEKDNITSLKETLCNYCRNVLKPTTLIYPITEKDYDVGSFITSQWNTLQLKINSALMITFFGYSAPKSDARAIELMKLAWGEIEKRKMEQTEIIDIKSIEDLHDTWSPFIYSHHFEVHNDFYDSWIANHPRRTIEAYYGQYWKAKFIDNNPIPRDLQFQDLWEFFESIKESEENY